MDAQSAYLPEENGYTVSEQVVGQQTLNASIARTTAIPEE